MSTTSNAPTPVSTPTPAPSPLLTTTTPSRLPPVLAPLPAAPVPHPAQPRHTHLFGTPLSHSLSPTLHASIFNTLSLPWTYTPYASDTLEPVLPLLGCPSFAGAAVTMPHKTDVIRYMDYLTTDAAAVGAVNTIIVRDLPGQGRVLVGGNTDWMGILAALGPEVARESGDALIVGAGATARAAVWALKQAGVDTIWVLNRDASEIAALVSHFAGSGLAIAALPPGASPQIRAVVACVPDFEPSTAAERQVRELLWGVLERGGGTVLDLCYKPRITATLRKAGECGWKCVDGLEVVIWQGVKQQVLWTGFEEQLMGVTEAAELVRGKEDGVVAKL
ncbi:hypothetical protein EDC01DRAFT_403611 [Geopyxis carbonaria]|nr:hypothetical protein EDC01DRAFT_403611 [Geopyxis carbonaria]